jgi:hypothetical protein
MGTLPAAPPERRQVRHGGQLDGNDDFVNLGNPTGLQLTGT